MELSASFGEVVCFFLFFEIYATIFKCYQMKKMGDTSTRGGARQGAGRPKGGTKTKLSVTIDTTLHEKAKMISNGNFSSLVESVLMDHIKHIKTS